MLLCNSLFKKIGILKKYTANKFTGPPLVIIADSPLKVWLMNPLQEQFVLFSKFGDPRSDGKTMTLSQSDKWMKQAHIFDGRTITLTETGISFNKFRARTVNYHDYMKYLDDLAHSTGHELEELKTKMVSCGPPGVSKITANPTPKDKDKDKEKEKDKDK